jgi:hypothetical protein
MFQKADGTRVWLSATFRLPYLSISGTLDGPDDYQSIRDRLRASYKLVCNIGVCGDAYLVRELDGGSVVFCADPNKECAVLMLGEVHCSLRTSGPRRSLADFFELIEDAVDDVRIRSGAQVRLHTIRSEVALLAA